MSRMILKKLCDRVAKTICKNLPKLIVKFKLGGYCVRNKMSATTKKKYGPRALFRGHLSLSLVSTEPLYLEWQENFITWS